MPGKREGGMCAMKHFDYDQDRPSKVEMEKRVCMYASGIRKG